MEYRYLVIFFTFTKNAIYIVIIKTFIYFLFD